MRDDLLDAQACVDWAKAQLPTLETRIDAWFNLPSHRVVAEDHREMGQKLFKLSEVKPLPPIVNAEVGAIVNSLRSSLDLLATALAKRHCVLRSDEMYFPIAKSAAQFAKGGYKGHELVKGLPADDRRLIEALKPYSGGNDDLVALHELDIMRKHRRLIGVDVIPTAVVVTPAAQRGGVGFPARWQGFYDGAVVAWMNVDATEGEFAMPLTVTFNETKLIHRRPVMSALSDFARLAESILKLFD
jgi:hypothetical protein